MDHTVARVKYSVIVPTYNEEHYILKCLQAINDQRYDRAQFEIILADSDSTDNTQKVAKPLCDRIIATELRGIALGRNRGAAEASGECLLFVDADAVIEQDFLHQLDRCFRDRSVVAVTGVARPSDGRLLQRFVYVSTYGLVRAFKAIGLALFPGICVAYRREAFQKGNGFREDFGIVEDLDLSRRISKLGKCVVCPKAVAHVSTRRLQQHALSTVLFHVYNDLKYLFTGTAAGTYPKREELKSWLDLWRQH